MKSRLKRDISLIPRTTLLAPVNLVRPCSSSIAREISPVEIYNLKVNSTANPVGIDTNPTFSWMLTSEEHGKSQSAYRIIVATTAVNIKLGFGDLWDSKKTTSKNNYDVIYNGCKLSSKTTYYWAVQVWDEAGAFIGVSDVTTFSTGIFTDSEWEGDWIGRPTPSYSMKNLIGANWIWRSNGNTFSGAIKGTEYFRYSFTVDAGKTVKEVLIGYTAYDQTVFYFNGQVCDKTLAWSTGGLFDATDFVNLNGNNTVAIAATKTSTGNVGMAAKIEISYTDGTIDLFLSNANWKVNEIEVDNWYVVDYNDSAWKVPDQVVAFGQSPWATGISLEVSGNRVAPLLRKEFNVTKTVKEAMVYICGLGFFDMKINGEYPDDSILNPGSTQYDQTVPYRTFDITKLIAQGGNAIGIELGNGFYNEIGGVWNWHNAVWRDNPKLLLNLQIKYTDGTTEIISTDPSWKLTNDGPTISNGINYGDFFDARKEKTGYDMPNYDDSNWISPAIVAAPTGKLSCQIMDPVRRNSTFSVKSINHLDNGSHIITTPEMVTGWIKLNINAPKDTKVTITYSEQLNSDGTVQKIGYGEGVDGNWWPHAYIQQDNYIAKGTGNESFEPKFSYKGFRYVQIDNYPGELSTDDVVIYRISNDVSVVSEFESSNPLINNLHKIMRATMQNNFQGKPTDTPVWEKNGWLGDANVTLNTMMYNFDMSNYLPNFIGIMQDCFKLYGTVPTIVPNANWAVDNQAVWNTIFVFGVDQLYNNYGQVSYVSQQYDVMRKFALKDITEIENNGWVWSDDQLSDWVSPIGGSDPNVAVNPNQSEGSGICGTAFVYGMLKVMAKFADRLGKSTEAAEYRSAMASIYSAFNIKFYNSTKQIYETTVWNQIGTRTKYRQTSNLLPLAYGIVPAECVGGVLANLVADIKAKNYHLDTGCVGTKYILPVLSDYGYSDVAYKILTQTTYPSWGYWLVKGSTSAWESWEATTRSMDHYFLGTYDEYFYSHLAGIQDITDGYKTFTIKPYMIGDLSKVSASVKTVRGIVESAWNLNDDGTAAMNITIPFGSTTEIYLPTSSLDGIRWPTDQPESVYMNGISDISIVNGQVRVTASSGTYKFVTSTDLKRMYHGDLD